MRTLLVIQPLGLPDADGLDIQLNAYIDLPCVLFNESLSLDVLWRTSEGKGHNTDL